jgi:TRAP-type uncharacterized transport system fused permease subunit
MAFVLTGNGGFLLWQGTLWQVLWASAVSAVAVAAMAATAGAWITGPARWPERVLCALGALVLLYLQPASMVAGGCLLAAAVAVHLVLRSTSASLQEGNHGEIPQ